MKPRSRSYEPRRYLWPSRPGMMGPPSPGRWPRPRRIHWQASSINGRCERTRSKPMLEDASDVLVVVDAASSRGFPADGLRTFMRDFPEQTFHVLVALEAPDAAVDEAVADVAMAATGSIFYVAPPGEDEVAGAGAGAPQPTSGRARAERGAALGMFYPDALTSAIFCLLLHLSCSLRHVFDQIQARYGYCPSADARVEENCRCAVLRVFSRVVATSARPAGLSRVANTSGKSILAL